MTKSTLQSVDGMLGPAVTETLHQLNLSPQDTAAARLARRYATAIDEGDAETLEKLGHRLLAALESLGATPRARALIKKGNASEAGGKLQTLRAAR